MLGMGSNMFIVQFKSYAVAESANKSKKTAQNRIVPSIDQMYTILI